MTCSPVDDATMNAIELPTSPDAPLLLHGDALDLLPQFPENSIDAIVDDPPAGIGFMHGAGRTWDSFKGYQPRTALGREVSASMAPCPLPRRIRVRLRERIEATILETLAAEGEAALAAVGGIDGARAMAARAVAEQGLLEPWEIGFVLFMVDANVEALRVLKPGALMIVWALPKTADLAGLAVRLAGFNVAESVLHLFAEGMPKGKNVGKAIDEMHAAERDVVGKRNRHTQGWKPKEDDVRSARVSNGFAHAGHDGNGGIFSEVTAPATEQAKRHDGRNTTLAPGHEHWIIGQKPLEGCTPERLRELTGLDYAWTVRDLAKPKSRAKAAKRWPEHASRFEDGAAWRMLTGRSLRRGYPNVLRLVRDGEIVAEVETGKYSDAPITSVAANVVAWGTGAIDIDACRVPTVGDHGGRHSPGSGSRRSSQDVYGDDLGGVVVPEHPGGRWPANVVLSEGGDACPAAELDRQSHAAGMHSAGSALPPQAKWADQNSAFTYGIGIGNGPNGARHGDSGGASRFYTRFRYEAKNSDRRAGLRTDIRNEHNTVKPVPLMRWLQRLVCPSARHLGGQPGIVLSRFLGSGTDGVAAVAEGLRFVGIERDSASFEVARARILAAIGSPEAAAEANAVAPQGAQMSLL